MIKGGEFMNNDYYVYIYWRLDINEPFYVGKGKGNRWRNVGLTRRSSHFINIFNSNCFVSCCGKPYATDA